MITTSGSESLERERSHSDASGASSTGDSGVTSISAGSIHSEDSHSELQQQAVAAITNPLMLKAQQLEQILNGLWARFFIGESFQNSDKVNKAMSDAYLPVKNCVNDKRNPSSTDPHTYDKNLSTVQSYNFDNPALRQQKTKKASHGAKQPAVTSDDMMIFHYKCALQYYMVITLAIENYKYLITQSAEQRYWADIQRKRQNIFQQRNADIAFAEKQSINHQRFRAGFPNPNPVAMAIPQSRIGVPFIDAQPLDIETSRLELRRLKAIIKKLEIDAQSLVEQKNAKTLTIATIDKVFEAKKMIAVNSRLSETQQELKSRYEAIKAEVNLERKKWFSDKGYIREREGWLAAIEVEFKNNDFVFQTYKHMYENYSTKLLARHSRIGGDRGIVYQNDIDPLNYLQHLRTYTDRELVSLENELAKTERELDRAKQEAAALTQNIQTLNQGRFEKTCFDRQQQDYLAATAAAANQRQQQQQQFGRQQQALNAQQQAYADAQRQLQTQPLPQPLPPEPRVMGAGILAEHREAIVKWQAEAKKAAENLQRSLGDYFNISGKLGRVTIAIDPINAYLDQMKLVQESLI